ncbi:odorant receptor 110 [Tribolium castaneum]|uniref:Odorant receptor n=1 Tax=Tribolium castaneum TaxID=7070 RepID=D6WV60_TRICA|nr:odorant receptor 110 [Tribolium castaneum]
MDKVEFSDPLFFLNVIGMHPFKADKFSKFRLAFSIAVYFAVIFSGVLELIVNSQGLETYARASDTLIPQCQLVCKIFVLAKYKKQIARLLNGSQRFWDLGQFGARYGNSFGKTHKYLKSFFLLYKVMLTFTCLQFLAVKIIFKIPKPIAISFGETKGLEPLYDHLYLVLHAMITLVTINLVNGFDGLFFYFIGHVLTELKMVKVAFGDSPIETNWSEEKRFKFAVRHHRFVLDFIEQFNIVYCTMLLVQHLTCLFGICFGVFLMTKDGVPPDLDRASKYLPYIVTFIFQTFTFCFAGNLLLSWSLEIPNEIFYHDWAKKTTYENKLAKIISMKRGQRAARLTLGGFANLDLDSFRMVLKNALSFFTFVNAMMNKKAVTSV